MNSENSFLNTLFERLEQILRAETVVGAPLNVGRITIIPLISVSLGVGGREGAHSENTNKRICDYGGAGCTISPHTLLVIKDDEVNVLPLTDKGSIDEEMLPEIISKMGCSKEEDKTADKSKKSRKQL